MSVDEVSELLGWTEAEKAAHLRTLDERPESNLDEVLEVHQDAVGKALRRR